MQGRVEHKIHIENNINEILSNMPDYVTKYYYNISVDKEPMSCIIYLRQIRQLFYFLFGKNKITNQDIMQISENDISKYFHSIEIIVDKEGNKKESSFAHRKGTWSALNSFFTYLKRNKYINENPMETISYPKNKDEVKHVLLDTMDLNLIINSVKNGVGTTNQLVREETWGERDMLIIVMLMTTGMRETALTEINVSDMNFETMTFSVIDKRHKVHEYTINSAIEKALKEWLPKREELLNGKKEDALFISIYRTRITAQAISNITQKYTKVALGKALSPHKFRAAFCSILYEQKGDVEYVRDAVGHSSIETTKRYIVKKRSARKEAENFMANNLNIV